MALFWRDVVPKCFSGHKFLHCALPTKPFGWGLESDNQLPQQNLSNRGQTGANNQQCNNFYYLASVWGGCFIWWWQEFFVSQGCQSTLEKRIHIFLLILYNMILVYLHICMVLMFSRKAWLYTNMDISKVCDKVVFI